MTLDEFKRMEQPAPGLSPALRALWHDLHGNWEEAHRIAQDIDTVEGAWIHAYLHRKEGDLANAGYWYRRAQRPAARNPLDDEWASIASALLEGGADPHRPC